MEWQSAISTWTGMTHSIREEVDPHTGLAPYPSLAERRRRGGGEEGRG